MSVILIGWLMGSRAILHPGFVEMSSVVYVKSCRQTNQLTNKQMDTGIYTVGMESIHAPLNFSLFVSLQLFAKILKVNFISH